jgi:hypothetical protein
MRPLCFDSPKVEGQDAIAIKVNVRSPNWWITLGCIMCRSRAGAKKGQNWIASSFHSRNRAQIRSPPSRAIKQRSCASQILRPARGVATLTPVLTPAGLSADMKPSSSSVYAGCDAFRRTPQEVLHIVYITDKKGVSNGGFYPKRT